MNEILLCCVTREFDKLEEINNAFRWGRIVSEIGWRTDCPHESLYSLGTSGGTYNGFLGPFPARLKQRRKKTTREDRPSVSSERRIAGSLVTKPEIEAYLERLCRNGSIALRWTSYEMLDHVESLSICGGDIPELTITEAAQLWPLLITDDRSRVRIKTRSQ